MKQCAVAALLLVLLPRGTHALRGLADTTSLHGAHADNLGVDGRGDAVVHLAVELGEHVGCGGWRKGGDVGSVSLVLKGSACGRDGVRRSRRNGDAAPHRCRPRSIARTKRGRARVAAGAARGGCFFLGLHTHSRRRRTPGDRGWPRTRRCCERGSASPPCPWAPWSRRPRRTRA